MTLTVKDIKAVAEQMAARAIKPKRIETQGQADRQNAIDAALGLDWTWSVGDEYYEVSDFQQCGLS